MTEVTGYFDICQSQGKGNEVESISSRLKGSRNVQYDNEPILSIKEIGR